MNFNLLSHRLDYAERRINLLGLLLEPVAGTADESARSIPEDDLAGGEAAAARTTQSTNIAPTSFASTPTISTHSSFLERHFFLLVVALLLLLLLATVFPLKFLVLAFVWKRFQKGLKEGKVKRRNRQIVLGALRQEGRRWWLRGMGGSREVAKGRSTEQGQSNWTEVDSWDESTDLRDVFRVIRSVSVRDWVHTRYYRNSFPLSLLKLQNFRTVGELAKVITSESLFFLRKKETERTAGGKAGGKNALIPVRGLFRSLLDHVPSNFGAYEPESCDYFQHRIA